MTAFKCLGVLLLIGLAEGYFEDCQNTYYLNPDSTAYLKLNYQVGTSCLYNLIAPLDYEILVQCDIQFYQSSGSCITEYFYIDREGDTSLSTSEYFCGTQTVARVSLFRKMVIAFTSDATNTAYRGSFNCNITTRPQACDCGWGQNTRIVGGVDAAVGEYPSMVALWHTPSAKSVCGGDIISHRSILTAYHCLQQYPTPSEIKILAGDFDLTSNTESKYQASYDASYYILHSNFDPTTNENDIAIIITSTNIEWSRGVGPACLPFGQESNSFVYTQVQIIGWGTTSFAGSTSPTLKKADVNVIDQSVCQSVYPSVVASQMCTYYQGRDSCQLDSGGPVIYKGVRQFDLGVISYGNGCGENPGVNTRVTSFLSWISGNALGVLCPKPFN